MKLKVYAVGRSGRFEAKGIYDGKKVKVLKGSRISSLVASNVNPIVKRIRDDHSIVGEDYVLKKDVEFRSSSTAATFVSGNISNGKRVWKDENGTPIGKGLKG